MTDFMRRMLAFVIVLAVIVPGMAVTGTPARAQSGVDGSACWPQGALTGVSGGQMTWSQAPATIIDPAQSYQASMNTTAGTILIQLDSVNAPIATNNFICLSLAGYYTGTDFHRIFAGYLIQGGDPSGTGTGNPGYYIPSDPTLGQYPVGSVAMANAVPNQNGSQFFIAAADLTEQIPAEYPVFGQVTGGMDVVLAISQGAVQPLPTGEQSKPVEPTTVLGVTIQSAAGTTGEVGPAFTVPTQTPVAPPQPTAISPTVAPTQPSTTGDAQGRPGGASAAANPTTVTGTTATGDTGCAGLADYQAAFEESYTSAAIANPEAIAVLLEAQNNPETQGLFDELTPEEATALSGFYRSLADAIEAITPPAFAAEWHMVQIEIFRALSEFSANIASQGLMFASMQASSTMGDLSARSDAATATAEAICPGFAAWALGEEGE
ncbi:MAG: peptidylprolyl isomerase [Thermomicrobiales bacterium]|nr:MAG: peptidylprolyl isomerase [Thermomicrobiales bacterium]